MKNKTKKQEDGSFWAFALINGRLAEFHYEVIKGKSYMTYGHCYVRRSEYKTKKEQMWIDKDTAKNRFTYRNKQYRMVGERKVLPRKHFRIPKRMGKGMTLEQLKRKLKI